MSEMLNDLMRFIDTEPYEVIRVSEICNDGEIETVERQKVSFCQRSCFI